MNQQLRTKPFEEWIGRTTESTDIVTRRLVESFRAIFDPHLAETDQDEAPLGVHWCLSPAIAPMAQLGNDGHPAKNLSLPPVPQPRRMWAGGTLEVLDALRVNDRVHRVSTIADISRKEGQSGELWFVAVNHEYSTNRGLALRERHDIVYREAARPGSRDGRPPERTQASPAQRSWFIETSPTLLFRYSAITFNGHRIHYDFPYATQVEGYEGLVVHGPIQATLLLNLAAVTKGKALRHFSYRGLSPAIAGRGLAAHQGVGDDQNMFWTEGPGGVRHMQASVG